MLMESRTSWKPFKARYSFPHKLWFPPNTNGNWHKIFSWIKPRSWCSNSPLSWLTLGSLFFSLNQTKICPSLLSYRDQMTEQRKHKQRMGKRVFCQGYSWSWLCYNFRSPQQCPKSSEHWRETLKWWDFSSTGRFSYRTICWSWSSTLLEPELFFVEACTSVAEFWISMLCSMTIVASLIVCDSIVIKVTVVVTMLTSYNH